MKVLFILIAIITFIFTDNFMSKITVSNTDNLEKTNFEFKIETETETELGATHQSIELNLTSMKNICELAVMDYYYSNIATYKQEDAQGMWLWKKDKEFWIEYNGIVTLGINATLLDFEVIDNLVMVTLPDIEVLEIRIDDKSLSADSIFKAPHSADITADDQIRTFNEAQQNMIKSVIADTTLFNHAQDRVKILLENYINNIGKQTDINYTIEWNNTIKDQ
ncbi:hypothetical protein AN641_03060 [Candidatus Epulonipiscioides gigas]|nr:hypothetical protein AN641_03060 [Epulopiscium sp. SCG-C07WGA-EpuloA2]